MDVINDLTSSLSSDLNSTELAKDLGLGFLAKSTAINGAVNLGIKLLEILFTLFLCWLMIRISSKLVNKFLRTQVQREKLSMSERKAKTLSTVTGSILKYVIYFIGLMSILKQLGVSLRIPRCHCLRRLGCHRSGRAEHCRGYDGGLLHPL